MRAFISDLRVWILSVLRRLSSSKEAVSNLSLSSMWVKITSSICVMSWPPEMSCEQSCSTKSWDRYRTLGSSPEGSSSSLIASDTLPSRHFSLTLISPISGRALPMKDELPALFCHAFAPKAMSSARAVLPEPFSPMMPTKPGFSGILLSLNHSSPSINSIESIILLSSIGVGTVGPM